MAQQVERSLRSLLRNREWPADDREDAAHPLEATVAGDLLRL